MKDFCKKKTEPTPIYPADTDFNGFQNCCGAVEIGPVEDYTPEETVRAVADYFDRDYFDREDHVAFLLFSGRVTKYNKGAGELMDYINNSCLGEVVYTDPTTNPSTRNKIVAYIWTPDWKALKVWAKEHPSTLDE